MERGKLRRDNESAVWRCCYEYAEVTSRLKRLGAGDGYRAEDECRLARTYENAFFVISDTLTGT